MTALILAAVLATSYEVIPDKTTIPVLTPTLAERKIARIRLGNQLEAYLISDPGVDQSAAAVAVEAGSWSDPQKYPGMAHFCEHMLFMGNKAYPTEVEYFQYVQDNGGSLNAFTAADRTVYMFSVNNEAFTGGLDRFSHFFIDPLFDPSGINHELHAVDQEFAKNVQNDGWRQEMILKETGNPDHPNAAFSIGNASTLSGIPQSALTSWYESHYSANRMRLVAISNQPLQQLIDTIVEKFSPVPNRNLPAPQYPATLLSSNQQGHFIYIKPVKDLKNLTLAWQPEALFVTDETKHALDLTAYALSNPDKNGLIQLLKRSNLAESLSVRFDPCSHEEGLFQINIDLTEEGVKKIDAVIAYTFQALALLQEKGIPSYIFDEFQKISQIAYQYQSRQEAFSFIQEAGYTIVDENLSTYPEKTAIPTTYDPQFVASFLKTLTPQTCVYGVMANPELTGVATDTKEKWMEAEYTIKPIAEPQLLAWSELKSNAQIGLRAANPYVPQNLALLPAPPDEKPQLLTQDDSATIYFAQDGDYKVPETATIFSLKTPLFDGSAHARALVDLYLCALTDALYGPLAEAKAAGFSFDASVQDLKIVFSLAGYSDKVPLFLKTLFQNLKTVHPTAEQFAIYKQSLLSTYDNASKELPIRQAMAALAAAIYNDAPSAATKYDALQNISYEQFTLFAELLFKKAYTQGVIFGNLTQSSATTLWSDLQKTLAAAPYPLIEQVQKHILVLSNTKGPYIISKTTPMQGNGALLMLQEGPFSFEMRAIQQVLSMALSNQFFETLRTKQQVGYIAQSRDVQAEKQLYQLFLVQSSTHQPQELLARFELFLEEFSRDIAASIPEERFTNIRDNLIKTLEMPPENQFLMAQRLNTIAFQYDADFSWVEKRVAALRALSYDTVLKSGVELLSRQNLRRLAILMQGAPAQECRFRYQEISPDEVRSAGKFVSAR